MLRTLALAGISVEDLADDAGLGRSTVYHYLRATKRTSEETLDKLDAALRRVRRLWYPTPELIQERLRALGWSDHHLAAAAGIAVGTANRIARGGSVLMGTRRRVDEVLRAQEPVDLEPPAIELEPELRSGTRTFLSWEQRRPRPKPGG